MRGAVHEAGQFLFRVPFAIMVDEQMFGNFVIDLGDRLESLESLDDHIVRLTAAGAGHHKSRPFE
jgi:hypothetical protein